MKERVKESYTCPYCGHTWVLGVYPPNYCANSDCRRPISEKAKAKQRERYARYALSKIKDFERFKELWMKAVETINHGPL